MQPLKFKALLLGVLFLSGCGDYVINRVSLENAKKLCASNGGIEHISTDFTITLRCKNGAKFHKGLFYEGN